MHRIAICLLAIIATPAADRYLSLGVEIQASADGGHGNHVDSDRSPAYAVIAGGEAYVDGSQARVYLRLGDAAATTGTLVRQRPDGSGMVCVPFAVPAASASAAEAELAKAAFTREQQAFARRQLYQNGGGNRGPLSVAPPSGSLAWWRSRSGEATRGGQDDWRRTRDMDELISLFSGTRALAENLQFERTLAMDDGAGTTTVSLDSVNGVSLRPVNWAPLIAAEAAGKPAFVSDLLASRIPADQHALLVPGFPALVQLLNRADGLLTLPAQLMQGRSEDAGIVARYQRQLGLEMTDLAKRFGDAVIAEVAITGSDPFLRLGTDLGVLFSAKQPAVLNGWLTQVIAQGINGGATPDQGSASGIPWRGCASTDGRIARYLLVQDGVFAMCNSRAQIERLAAVWAGKARNLGALDEYRFFRLRYPRTTPGALALGVIPDEALRRWCSPRWRIADARRLRALGELLDLTPTWIAAGARADWTIPPGHDGIVATAQGLRHARYGSVAALTPIAELEFDRITETEAKAYARFRDTYEQSWRGLMDPIAVNISDQGGVLAADLTVLPLIIGSDYNTLGKITGSSHLDPAQGDRHNCLAQLAISIDEAMVAQAGRQVGNMTGTKANALAWFGGTLALHMGDAQIWEKLAVERHHDFEQLLSQMPIALSVGVREPIGASLFLMSFRAFAGNQFGGNLQWEERTHAGVTYSAGVRMGDVRNGISGIFYRTDSKGLTITFCEDYLKSIIERHARPDMKPSSWLGDQADLRLTPKALVALSQLCGQGGIRAWAQQQAWAWLPLLNEWRRRFPGEDPVAVHERLWGIRPVDPAGKGFVWDGTWQTMTSKAYGCPAAPLEGPELTPALAGIGSVETGVGLTLMPAEKPLPPGPDEEMFTVKTKDDPLLKNVLKARLEGRTDDSEKWLIGRNRLSIGPQMHFPVTVIIPREGRPPRALTPGEDEFAKRMLIDNRQEGLSYTLRARLRIEPGR